jgi:GntR family transcriptional regulator
MYAQIVEQVIAKVMAGAWAPGAPLPSIRELAAGSNVSVITVKRAYQELERAGVIVTRQGKGSFVAERIDATRARASEEFRLQLARLVEAGRQLGMGPADVLERVREALAAEGDGH